MPEGASTSPTPVPMARELGMSPMKLGKLDNHEHEPWKMPLQEYNRAPVPEAVREACSR